MHTSGVGVEICSYNGWDDAYTQYYYKYVVAGHTRPQPFLDAQEPPDWSLWKINGNSYYGQTSVVGTTLKIYYMEAYSFNTTAVTEALNRTIYGDIVAPYTVQWYPAPNSSNVNRNTNISCHILDAGVGLIESSVTMTVWNGTTSIPGSFTKEGNFLDYLLQFDPTSLLPANTLITCKVNGKDLNNNTMPEYSWSFTTIDDANVTPTSLGHVKALFN